MEDLSVRLVDKSIEAFIMGLEIYNKPTITYRIEGFSFFICNAWELMLKSHLIKRDGIDSIFFKNDKQRTISLSRAVRKIYTDSKQPLRINIEEIISLRDTATHFITEDDEILYAPFFQANILNFSEQIKKFHDINITEYIPQNFLTLSTSINLLSDEEIQKKYSKDTALNMLNRKHHLEKLQDSINSNDLHIPLRIELFNTKKKDDADATYSIDPQSDEGVRIIKTEVDPSKKYHLSRKQVIDGIQKQITAKNILFNYTSSKEENNFNDYTLRLIMDYYNLKDGHSYTFVHSTRYSQQLVDEVVNIILQNPDVIEHIKKR